MELTGGRPTSARLITRDLTFAANVNLRDMTEQVRAYLGVSVEDQQRWGDDDTALKHWRKALLDGGVYVFKDAFRVEEFSGFCLYDDIFPIIYVNNSSAKTRQMFTLFHELAHLLFHTSGIDTIHDEYIPHLADEAKRIEILCNRFAAEFLLPEQAFNAAIRGLPATEVTAERVAASFHVSREVVFRRFLDRGLIDQHTYNERLRVGRPSARQAVVRAAITIGPNSPISAAITSLSRSVNIGRTASMSSSSQNI